MNTTTLSPRLAFCLLTLAVAIPALADLQALTEFQKGETNSFSTRGHRKARGVSLSMAVPKSWAVTETKEPNDISSWISDNGKGFETLKIFVLPIPGMSQKMLTTIFSNTNMLSSTAPPNGKVISAKLSKVGGQTAGLLECNMTGQDPAFPVTSRLFIANFPQGTNILCLMFMVHDTSGNLERKAVAFQPLFDLMIKSVTFEEGKK
jgi:hypothetical protein